MLYIFLSFRYFIRLQEKTLIGGFEGSVILLYRRYIVYIFTRLDFKYSSVLK